MDKKKVTLLISTYNWKDALRLCLLSASQQTVMPDEIVVADDGSTEDTIFSSSRLNSREIPFSVARAIPPVPSYSFNKILRRSGN